jgi:hypothetical protein
LRREILFSEVAFMLYTCSVILLPILKGMKIEIEIV